MLALGVGEATLAAATLLGPDPLTGWTMALLAVGSFALGAFQVTGRMPLEVTARQERLFREIVNATLVCGVFVTLVGGLLLADAFL